MDHRNAMEKTMASQLIENGTLKTTLVKAKWIRSYVEKIITKAKQAAESTDKITKFNVVKLLRTRLATEGAVRKAIEVLAPEYAGRHGGYTRVIKTGNRDGDNSATARVELLKTDKKEAKEAKTTKKAATKPAKAKVAEEKGTSNE